MGMLIGEIAGQVGQDQGPVDPGTGQASRQSIEKKITGLYRNTVLTQVYTHNPLLTGDKGEYVQFLLEETIFLIGNLKTTSQKMLLSH